MKTIDFNVLFKQSMSLIILVFTFSPLASFIGVIDRVKQSCLQVYKPDENQKVSSVDIASKYVM